MHCFPAPVFLLYRKCVAFPIKQKALRVDRTAAEKNLSLRDPPQAQNPASQDSIFLSQVDFQDVLAYDRDSEKICRRAIEELRNGEIL